MRALQIRWNTVSVATTKRPKNEFSVALIFFSIHRSKGVFVYLFVFFSYPKVEGGGSELIICKVIPQSKLVQLIFTKPHLDSETWRYQL